MSAVVINWNSGDRLRRLLDSLNGVPLARLLVVDNASEDDSLDRLPEQAALEIVRNETNVGFAAAANRAIERIETPFLLLLNPDVVMQGPQVGPMLDEICRRPEAAIVCPLLVDRDAGRPQFTFQIRPLPSPARVISDALFLDELVEWVKGPRPGPDPGMQEAVPVAQPAAACWLMRRQAWVDLAGFDESFAPAWFEDVDFCLRLEQAGWKCYLLPWLTAEHDGGYSVGQLGHDRFVRLYYGNLLRYCRKHHALSYPVIWPAVQAGLLARRWRRL